MFSGGSAGRLLRIQAAQHHDNHGPVAKYSRGPQTGLSTASRSALVAGNAAGVPVKELETNVAAIEQAAIRASCETRLLVDSLRHRNTTTEQESLIRAHGGRLVYLLPAASINGARWVAPGSGPSSRRTVLGV